MDRILGARVVVGRTERPMTCDVCGRPVTDDEACYPHDRACTTFIVDHCRCDNITCPECCWHCNPKEAHRERTDINEYLERRLSDEYQRQVALAMADHPEETCGDCGGRNVVPWWTSSDRWRLAISTYGGTPAVPDHDAILCPVCFVARWERATGLTAIWRIEPDPATIRAQGGDEWFATQEDM